MTLKEFIEQINKKKALGMNEETMSQLENAIITYASKQEQTNNCVGISDDEVEDMIIDYEKTIADNKEETPEVKVVHTEKKTVGKPNKPIAKPKPIEKPKAEMKSIFDFDEVGLF